VTFYNENEIYKIKKKSNLKFRLMLVKYTMNIFFLGQKNDSKFLMEIFWRYWIKKITKKISFEYIKKKLIM
jgi:hypothetical protein